MAFNHRPKFLYDLHRWDANLKVTCLSCGRSGIYRTQDVVAYFQAKGWNQSWEMVAGRFRCEGFHEGCGARNARVDMVPAPKPPEPPPPLVTHRHLKQEEWRRRG
jgi:hypothetical protein